MSTSFSGRCAAIAAFVFLQQAALAQLPPAPPVLYRLDVASSVTEGCFGPSPCACVAVNNPSLYGTMTVQFDHVDPANFAHYRIGNVNWVVTDWGGERHVAGRGTYRVGGLAGQLSELSLSLSIDGEGFLAYESGLVATTATFPSIEGDAQFPVVICTNRMFSVRATPVPANEIVPYHLQRSGYKVGFLPPCVGPLSKARMVGGFGLVDLGIDTDPATLHYALVDIGWSTVPAPAPPDRTFGGFGIYTVMMATGQHRLRCDLTDGNLVTERFDSALVNGGMDFPGRIDVDMAHNGFNCFDEVFLLHARP